MNVTTERLLLREFTAADWPAVLAYQSDPRYLRYYAWTGRTPAEVQAFVERFVDGQAEQPRCRFQLAVVLRDTGQLIGNCGVRQAAADATEAELGYEFDPNVWGRGYATEAARAMLAFGFEDLGLHRISARVIADNAASVRVLERLGLQREGRLRENEWFKDRWWDTLIYAILEHEWRVRG